MRVATDIGGTFTDVVVLDEDGIRGWKVLSTPAAPDRAVERAVIGLGRMASFSHGTTVATNALLERKGAKVALLATKGFKDLLYIARQQRPRLYDFDCAPPPPVIARDFCFEVDERLAPDGTVLSPLSSAHVEAVVEHIIRAGAEAVAISLLYAFINPAHEIVLEEAFKRRGLPVSRSSKIIPEFREFERASTTSINAFVQPVVRAYVNRIRKAVAVAGGPPDYDIMKSGGGVAASAEVHPVEMLLSGPAGGVSGAVLLGKQLRKKDLVTFDMGGTSADFSAIVNHSALWTDEGEINGLPIRLPVLDITTIGAGGGSIAWIDQGRALRVGPESAGSEPGPACYDRGGQKPTVTDANLLAGILSAKTFRGSKMHLLVNRAAKVLESLASSAKLSLEETILGVRAVVNANMIRGIRRTTVERGIDVRTCTLLAFGGAGPIHAADLARELGMTDVLVPPMAGMFSALGILLSDIKIDFGETHIAPWNSKARGEVEAIFKRFRKEARRSIARQGWNDEQTRFLAGLDMRYAGQSFHLPVPYSKEADMEERFHQAFRKRYGYAMTSGVAVQVVTVRLSAVTPRGDVELPEVKVRAQRASAEERKLLLSSGWQRAPVYDRAHLPSSFRRKGPLVVEDEGCTVFVPPGCELSIAGLGCLKISIE